MLRVLKLSSIFTNENAEKNQANLLFKKEIFSSFALACEEIFASDISVRPRTAATKAMRTKLPYFSGQFFHLLSHPSTSLTIDSLELQEKHKEIKMNHLNSVYRIKMTKDWME
uniref:Uncharacterized protein n=1 Tax=Onchocerca volvulus TaxID=6282 RepID=A0A8R1TIW5_ONCVO